MSQPPRKPSASRTDDATVARLVVENRLATPEEVQACIEQRKQDSSARSLASVLIQQGYVTERQMERLIGPAERDAKPVEQIPGYKLLKKLGAGAMATVYLARQVSLDRPVAVKVLPKRYSKNPEWVDRFYAEGRAAAKLNHPNIVGALDVGLAGEFHYFVMELVEGRTAYDDLYERGQYEEKEALDIIIQIARALEHAHQAGFIHRDVKPKNIMITREGVAKLADMGLARAVTDREAAEAEAGKAYGTPYYISPEQIRGQKDIDFRADIYGLGATFYHLVTGQVPFDGANPSAVMHKHLKAELTPPDHVNPSLSAGISEIIETCMAKSPEDRYATTSDLLYDLESVRKGEPPMQARKKFDLSSLGTLDRGPGDAGSDAGTNRPTAAQASAATPDLVEQPIFWIALAGWLTAVIAIAVAALK